MIAVGLLIIVLLGLLLGLIGWIVAHDYSEWTDDGEPSAPCFGERGRVASDRYDRWMRGR